jgi:hypothetical protein
VKKFSLKFPSLIYLTAFRRYAKATYWEINITNMVAHCDCSEKEATFACKEFKAVLVNENEDLDVTSQNWEINTTSLPRHAS